MGLWLSRGSIRNERQCGPHPGTSNIPCSKLSPASKYWITLTRRGNEGTMKVYTADESFHQGAIVAASIYQHTASYSNGVKRLGEANVGGEKFNGKIYCLRDTLPPQGQA